MKKFLSLFVIALVACSATVAAKPKVIAHRGFWDTPGSAQNSLKSLELADSIGCYGSEFDVWLTADNVLVVNHDDQINGLVIETSQSADILKQKLPNGETVPTLDAYLEKAKQTKVKLIFELKPHKNKAHETEAVKLSLAMLREKGLMSRTEFITFSPNAVEQFIKRTFNPVYYLNGDYSIDVLKDKGCAGADYHYGVFKKDPGMIKGIQDAGMKVNVWTVNKEADLQHFIDANVDFITTNDPLLAQKLIKASCKECPKACKKGKKSGKK